MANIIRTVIQFRRAHTEEWNKHLDVIPAEGEPCYDLDLHTLKIGDGNLNYGQLPVIGGKDEVSVSADGKSIVMTENVFKLAGFDEAATNAMPRRNAAGELEWVVPTIKPEELKTVIDSIESNVTNLSTTVTNIQNIVTPSEEGSVPLLDRIVALEEHTNKFDAKVNEFFNLTNDNDKVDTLMEIINYVDKHGTDFAGITSDVAGLKELVGITKVQDQILEAINASGHIADEKAKAMFEHVKYEISHKPVGTLVDYRDKEIRIMVPADAEFKHQNSGANANKNAYYIGFKAYAPEGAVNFKEDLAEIISDNTMYAFEGNDFAGIDEYGRKYSICWLAVAYYDEETQTWKRYAENSTKEKYIGWYYSVEWYDANGKMIGADCIRINLSNEACHTAIAKVVNGVSVGGTLMDIVNGVANIPMGAGLKGSEEIVVAEDGTMSVGVITWDKIANGDSALVLDGGGAA